MQVCIYMHAVRIRSLCGLAVVCASASVCVVCECVHIALVVYYNRSLHFVEVQFPPLGHLQQIILYCTKTL